MNKAKVTARMEQKKRKWASRIQKAKSIRCHYCGIPLCPATATREHLKPQASGGGDNDSNIVMACKRCNSARSSKPYEQFKALMLPTKRENMKKWPRSK